MGKVDKETLFKRLEKQLKNDNHNKAIKTAKKILKKYPDEFSVNLSLFKSYKYLDDFKNAEKYLITFYKTSEDNEILFESIIAKLISISAYDSAINIVDEKLLTNPSSDLILIKSQILYEKESAVEGLDFLNTFDSTNKHWKDILLFKGLFYNILKKYDNAVEIYNQGLKEFKNDIIFILRKFKTLKLMDNEKETLNFADELAKEEENKSLSLASKALFYSDKDKTKAINFLNKIFEDSSYDAYAYYAQANVYYFDEDFDLALDDILMSFDFLEELKDNSEIEESYFDEIFNMFSLLHSKLSYDMNDLDFALEILDDFVFEDFEFNEAHNLKVKFHNEKIMDIFSQMGLDESLEKFKEEYPQNIAEIDSFSNSSFNDSIESLFEMVMNEDFNELSRYEPIKYDYNKYESNLNPENKYDNSQIIDNENNISSEDKNSKLAKFSLPDDYRQLNTIEEYEEAIDEFYNEKGQEYFEENNGLFWKIVETRLFMLLLLTHSLLIWDDGRKDQAIAQLEHMLELDVDDNLGVKNFLIPRLLESNLLDEAYNYINSLGHSDESSMLFNRLLYEIKSNYIANNNINNNTDNNTNNNINTKIIEESYNKVIEKNKHIIPLLLSKKIIYGKDFKNYAEEDKNEAERYIFEAGSIWYNDENAMNVLKKLYK
ncbi:MAG: hypothetical protein LBU40_06850 [Methanobrevibacter sp.]|jgi:hypothetical protein|nr:hypothetical protein [Methanobrevibacter sp.]